MSTRKNNSPPIVTMSLQEALHRKSPLRPGEKSAKELMELSDTDIDYSDIAELNEEFWKYAKSNINALKIP